MSEINFDFYIAEANQKRLKEQQLRLERLAEADIEEILYELRESWDSDAGRAFACRMEAELECLRKTAALIGKAGEALHHASVEAKATEEKIKEIAENRKAES